MRDHMRRVLVTGLSRMRLVADPGTPALDTIGPPHRMGNGSTGQRGTSGACRQRGGSSGPYCCIQTWRSTSTARAARTSGCLGRIRGLQEGKPIGADGSGQPLACRVGFEEAVVLHPATIAFQPCWLHVGPQPRWSYDREAVQRVAHGFAHQFKPVEGPDGCEDMGGISPLSPRALRRWRSCNSVNKVSSSRCSAAP